MISMAQDMVQGLATVVDPTQLVAEGAAIKRFVDSYQGLTPIASPAAIVYPRTAADVQKTVNYAKEAGLNLVPVSSPDGPRTVGGSLPSPGQVPALVVDLSRMKGFIRMDRRNRVALIEPGVTFPELSAAAAEHGMRVACPLRPRAGKSVIASYLDREPTLIPKNHWDVTDPLLCIEFIFGTGELFRTGSAAGPGSLEEQWASGVAQTNPMGPAHTDLGRAIMGGQGTLGIVTWASVRLDLAPSAQRLFFVGAEDPAKLESFIYGGTRRRLGNEYVLLNNTALASLLGDTSDEIRGLHAQLPAWTLALVVAGYDYLPEEKMAFEEKGLAKLASQADIALKDSLPGVDNDKVLSLLQSAETGVSWKRRLGDGSVDIFFVSTLDRIAGYLSTMDALVAEHGFAGDDLGIYIQPSQQGRTAHIEFNLPYAAGDEEKAVSFHDAAVGQLLEMGAFFSRPHGLAAPKVFSRVPDHVAMLEKLKSVLDPDRVFNRGKLCF